MVAFGIGVTVHSGWNSKEGIMLMLRDLLMQLEQKYWE
jgi:hypothetical protein